MQKKFRPVPILSGIFVIALLAACSPTGGFSPSVQGTTSSVATQVPGAVMTSLPGLTTQVPALVNTQIPNAINTLAAVPITGLQFDQAYIDMMVPLNQGFVQMGQIAAQRAQHMELKALANLIVTGRQAEVTQLQDWEHQWYGSSDTPPLNQVPMIQGQGLNLRVLDLQAVISKVKNAPEPFDREFIDSIVPQYQAAIAAANLAETTASHAELKNLAQKMVSEEQNELKELTAWRSAWYGEASPLATPAP